VDTSFQQEAMFVGSALAQTGRTFRLFGPIDVGLVAGGLAKLLDRFPNVALDQTAALRLHRGGISFGIFGGINEAPGYLKSDVWSSSLQNGTFEHPFHLDYAPHIGAEVWGPNFDAGVTHQKNPMTDWTEAHADGFVKVRSGGIRLGGRYEQEVGQAIGYDRKRGAVELGVQPSPGLEVYATYGREDTTYGLVGLDNQYVLAGLRGTDTSGPRTLSVAIEQVFGGQDSLSLPPSAVGDILSQIEGLADFIGAVAAAQESQQMAALQKLSPSMQQEMAAEANATTIGDLIRLAGILVRPEAYERIIIRFLRHELLQEMSTKTIPILGQDVRLTPGAVLALVGAYQTGLAPIPPMTQNDANGALAGFLFKELKSQLGQCADSADSTAFTGCLLSKLPPDEAAKLTAQYGSQAPQVLDSALKWGATLVAREVDREALLVSEAAEQVFAEITVDGGARLTQLDRRWLVAEFDKRDRRGAGRARAMVAKAKAALEAELKLKEKELREKLTAFGRERLREVPGVDVPKKDLAPLIAFYGDDALFDFISAARSRVPASSRISVEFSPFSETGFSVVTDIDQVTFRLPPLPARTDAAAYLRSGLSQLEP
jgi:hypothetical protein